MSGDGTWYYKDPSVHPDPEPKVEPLAKPEAETEVEVEAEVEVAQTPPITVHTTDRFLTVPEVAELLGVSTMWVYRSSKNGGMPHKRVNKMLRFSKAEVLAWVDSGQAAS